MKKWAEKIKSLKNSRKLRCGGFSAALTAAAVVLVLLLSVLADSLEKRYALQADLSFNSLTTQGEVTDAVLSQLDKDVRIYALAPASGGDENLFSLLDRYAAKSPHVTWSEESILRTPALATAFSDSAGNRQVTEECLIVHCGETGRTRILNEDDYYTYSYNTETGAFDEAGYTYEKSLTEAVLYVSQDTLPGIQMLTGHGEVTKEDAAVLEETLVSANYLIRQVNLSRGDQLDAASPLMILSPRLDFSDAELKALAEFAAQGGDFFIVSRYADPLTLENYNALLRSYGISCYPGLVIAKESATDSYYAGSPVYLMPFMQDTEMTRPLLEAGRDIVLLGGARALQQTSPLPENVTLRPVLLTGDAFIRNYADGVSLSEQQETDEEGVFALALWADRIEDSGKVSHAFVIGNLSLFTDEWVAANTDASAFLLQAVRTLQGETPVNLDILPKNALREGLTLKSLTVPVIVIALLPLLLLLAAVMVLRPRKNL